MSKRSDQDASKPTRDKGVLETLLRLFALQLPIFYLLIFWEAVEVSERIIVLVMVFLALIQTVA